jgi:hypothetical protein
MPEELADRLLDLERYFREGRASGISGDVELVTGHRPRKFKDFLQNAAATGILDADGETR